MTARILNRWRLGRYSQQRDDNFYYNTAKYSGVHAVRLYQKVKYGDKAYFNSSGFYAQTKSEDVYGDGTQVYINFRPYCYLEDPTSFQFHSGGAPTKINVGSLSTPDLANLSSYLKLKRESACKLDPIRCGLSQLPLVGLQEWYWECNWIHAESFDDSAGFGPIYSTFAAGELGGPTIVELQNGFISHDRVTDNKADTEFLHNAYYVAPLNNGNYWNQSMIWWGTDGTTESDGSAVRLYENTSETWKVCMNVIPCTVYSTCEASCALPSRSDRFSGIDVDSMPLSINASELAQYPSMFTDALKQAVDEYNAVVPGIQFFNVPSNVGNEEVNIDIVTNDQRAQSPYHWTEEGIIPEVLARIGAKRPINGEFVATETEQRMREHVPGCKTLSFIGGTVRVGEERWFAIPDWDPLTPPVDHEAWTENGLKGLFMHELSHMVISLTHANDGEEEVLDGCPGASINCDGRSVAQFEAADIAAMQCMYGSQ